MISHISEDARDWIKILSAIIVGGSVAKATNDIIENNTDVDNTLEKVQVRIASLAIGGVVVEATNNRTDLMIDKACTTYNEWRARKNEEKTNTPSNGNTSAS